MDAEHTLENLLLEEKVCEAYGLRPSDMTLLRRAGLPFVALNMRRRAYWRTDLARFLFEQRTKTLGSDDTDSAEATDSTT